MNAGVRRRGELTHPRAHRWLGWLLLCSVWALVGCTVSIPSDPDRTLERVRGGVLRVGASVNEPWIVWTAEPEPTGRDAEVVRAFAASLGARVEWTRGGEEALMKRLENAELDLVAAGLTAETPWVDQAAISKPYLTVRDGEGAEEEHVFAVPLGENAFLLTLERFLLEGRAGPS